MKAKTFTITNALIAARVVEIVQGLDFDDPHDVTIKPRKENRSASQQGVQWMWNTDIGNFIGMTKDEAHDKMKKAYCVPILIRDDEGYRTMYVAVERLEGVARRDIEQQVLDLTSTTRLDLKQMAEYLTDMETFAASMRIPLRHPKDYDYAMGKRRGKK